MENNNLLETGFECHLLYRVLRTRVIKVYLILDSISTFGFTFETRVSINECFKQFIIIQSFNCYLDFVVIYENVFKNVE